MSSYKTILKTTGLFASLRLLTIINNLVTSKLVAVFVGPVGIGVYGMLINALNLITTISDFGISKSSIRNIAESEGKKDDREIIKTISLVNKIVYLTGIFGAIFTILFSFQLSKWSFGNTDYWLSFMLLGVCVFFVNVKNGQSAILQGLRKYKLITKSTILYTLCSFVLSIPIIYFFKEQSIIYIILLTSISSYFFTRLFLNKLGYKAEKVDVKLSLSNTSELIKLGVSMMLVSFLVTLSGYIIRTYIGNNGAMEDLGYFQAGFQIISGYFGLILTSISTDYFPRISAINSDNNLLKSEVNQQALITLLLIFPLVVILPFLMPQIIKILYTTNFQPTILYVNLSLFGIIFQSGSQTMGMILLAKNDAKVYTVTVFICQLIFVLLNLLGYRYYGIMGLGITFSINMLLHLIVVQLICYFRYKIIFNNKFYIYLIIITLLSSLSLFLNLYFSGIQLYIFGIILTVFSLAIVLITFKRLLGIKSYLGFFKSKINGKNN